MDKPLIILDGDLGPDPCDFATLAMAHILHRQGIIELKGVVGTLPEPYLVPALDYFRRYYENATIPVGVFKPSLDERFEIDKMAALYFFDFDPSLRNLLGYTILSWIALSNKELVISLVNDNLYSRWPATRILHDLYSKRYGSEPLKYENAVDGAELYKQILKDAADNSITLLVVGQLYNLNNLLKSSDGKELVNRKVKKIIMMIGSFECKARVENGYRGLFNITSEMWALYGVNNEFGKTSKQISDFMRTASYKYGEYNAYGFTKNLAKDVFAMLAQLDSKIKISLLGNEEGFKIPAGSAYQNLDYANPVKIAYLQNYNGNAKGVVKKDPAYDELALYYLAYNNEKQQMFEEHQGNVVFDEMGKSTFTDNTATGRFYRIVVKTSVEQKPYFNETRNILTEKIENIVMGHGGTAAKFLCASGGLTTDRSLLSCTSDGTKVDLWSVDDGSGRQSWELSLVAGYADVYNIKVSGGNNSDRVFLSCTADGTKVDLWNVDDGSGRQRWKIAPVAGHTNIYNVKVAAGTSSDRVFLSCTADGTKVDLWNVDDGSGRQRWKITPVAGHTNVYNVKVAAGTSNDRVFLSCTADGTKVDLWNVDDGSGRQRWKMPPLKNEVKFLCIHGGLFTDRALLSCTADGTKVDLWNINDGSGRQGWKITPVTGQPGIYNIKVVGGNCTDRVFLSCTSDGTKVDLWKVDDGSGRQRWKITPAAGYADVYNITVAGGCVSNKVFLSGSGDGTIVRLWDSDEGSGLQRWLLIGELGGHGVIIA